MRTESSSPETTISRASELNHTDVSVEEGSILPFSRCSSVHDVNTQPLAGGDNVIRIYTKSPHYLPLSSLALLMNPVLGIPAFVCSIISRKHRLDNNDRRSATYSKIALWLSIIAIASSIVVIIFIIVYVVVIIPNIIISIKGLSPSLGGKVQYSPEIESMATSTQFSDI